jgi:hypothetical protein
MKNKTLHGYYYNGKSLYELWIDDDGNITQKKIKDYFFKKYNKPITKRV